jgi:predicted HicB family RNase H-like nuclease
MTVEKIKKIRALRLGEELWLHLKAQAQKKQVSINRLIHLILTTSL